MLPQAFLDELRSRSLLSGLVAKSVKLTRAGREFKGCCPFHDEKTPSFTVIDDKGFYHCFGCGAHGDAIRWVVEHDGLSFVEAVRRLADDAGMVVPTASPEAAAAARVIEGQRPTLDAAAALFAERLGDARHAGVRDWLAARGIGADMAGEFGMGFAPEDGALNGQGFTQRDLTAVGLVGRTDAGFVYPRFRSRVMVPIHDAQGRIVGFTARHVPTAPGAKAGAAKWVNSPDCAIFDKGATLFNLHRVRVRFRQTKRLVIAEGGFDVVALHACGFAAVAPMGTAVTVRQLERAWRLDPCPLLLFDGDAAGAKAAVRAGVTALPLLGPGRSLRVATLPAGCDPDDVVQRCREAGEDAALALGVLALGVLGGAARPVEEVLFDAAVAEGLAGSAIDDAEPEARAAVWVRLRDWAHEIADTDTRGEYLAVWRARFERRISAAGQVSSHPIHHPSAQLGGTWDATHRYFWPDPVDEAEAELIRFIRAALDLRADRRALTERARDLAAMAKLRGLTMPLINRVAAEIETDPEAREGKEAIWALYRRIAGVEGPMTEALLPSLISAGAQVVRGAPARRLAMIDAMIEGGV